MYYALKEYCRERGFDNMYSCLKHIIAITLVESRKNIDHNVLPDSARLQYVETKLSDLEKKIDELQQKINDLEKRIARLEKTSLIGWRK